MGTIDIYVRKRDIDALAMNNLAAKVGTLAVGYYDKNAGRQIQQTVSITGLHFSGGDAMFRVSASPVMVGKAGGILAKIDLNSTDVVVIDPVSGNNSMRINNCEVRTN